MFAISGSTGVILGNAVVYISIRGKYYFVDHLHSISLGEVIARLHGIMYFRCKYHGCLHQLRRSVDIPHYDFPGILLTFTICISYGLMLFISEYRISRIILTPGAISRRKDNAIKVRVGFLGISFLHNQCYHGS